MVLNCFQMVHLLLQRCQKQAQKTSITIKYTVETKPKRPKTQFLNPQSYNNYLAAKKCS